MRYIYTEYYLVAEHEPQLSFIAGILQNGADDLEHGGDTGAARHHADTTLLVGHHVVALVGNGELAVGQVSEVTLGPLHLNDITYFQSF